MVRIATVVCKRCGHKWVPRKPKVMTCAKCRSPYWNTDKQSETQQSAESEEGAQK